MKAHTNIPGSNNMPQDHAAVLKVQQLVSQHFRNQRDAGFYAEQAKISLSQLNRLLKTYLGKTITVLVQDRIHNQAESMLVNSTLSCKQIAFDLGVSDPPYFSRCFKKRTGMTPTQFRQKYQALPDLALKPTKNHLDRD